MSLNQTPSAERVHIAFFGRRNVGKSSVVNAITAQKLSIVSNIKGTTTDPVFKAMELLPVGPVMIIDTPGSDDSGTLGEMRVKSTYRVLSKTDVAVLIADSALKLTKEDKLLIGHFKTHGIPYLIAYNKCDLLSVIPACQENEIYISAKDNIGIHELKDKIAVLAKPSENTKRIIKDFLNPNDIVVLVVPIDEAAPKGRLILPQQQTIRDILDSHAVSVVTQENELKNTLSALGKKPKLVITDSQAFERVNCDIPPDIPLTSFSILFANYKGNLKSAVEGAYCLDKLQDGDTVLISEGCTHHRQCNDIGTVKMPRWILDHTQKDIKFEFTSGTEFSDDLSAYRLIIHCGGCMLNGREMKYRLRHAEQCGVPMTNYGIVIAHIHGILKRSIDIFPDIAKL